MFYLFLRERAGKGQRERGDRGSEVGLELMNCEIITWSQVDHSTSWATQKPLSFLFSVYLFLRETETECEWVRGRERGRHRIQSRLQVLSCQHRAPCGARTREPQDHDLSRSWMLNRLSPPGCPCSRLFLNHANNSSFNPHHKSMR